LEYFRSNFRVISNGGRPWGGWDGKKKYRKYPKATGRVNTKRFSRNQGYTSRDPTKKAGEDTWLLPEYRKKEFPGERGMGGLVARKVGGGGSEGWRESWRAGGLEAAEVGREEDWKTGGLEDWRTENWRPGGPEGGKREEDWRESWRQLR
jgi:hypothetical protein